LLLQLHKAAGFLSDYQYLKYRHRYDNFIFLKPSTYCGIISQFWPLAPIYQIKEQIIALVRLIIRFIGSLALSSRMKIGSGREKIVLNLSL